MDVWRKQFDALARTHRVLTSSICRLWAFGDPVSLSARYAAPAGSRRAQGDAGGRYGATIIGSSLGGAVAIEFAFRWPEFGRSSLVLIDPAGMTHKVAWPLRLMTVRSVGEALSFARTGHAPRRRSANASPTQLRWWTRTLTVRLRWRRCRALRMRSCGCCAHTPA